MPSRFEPCGLNQMYSQAYGTPPIVAPVGGLLDSVIDATADPVRGTGFVMPSCDARGLDDALARAFEAWRQPQLWRRLQASGMTRNFGWEDSANRYLEVYRTAIAAHGRAPGVSGISQP
jgi:starch synthase